MQKKMYVFFFILLILQSCASKKEVLSEKYFSHAKDKNQSGFDAQALKKVSAFVEEKAVTTGVVVLHKGELVYQYGDVEKLSYIASCRKSVLSILLGKYVEDGTIDLTTSIGELNIDEKDGLLPIEKTTTIYDLITSRSGVHHVASNGGYDKANFQERGTVQPGEFFVYNNWDFNVAGHILEVYAGKSIYEELEAQLAIPLGFEDWKLKRQKKSGKKSKSQYKAYHMYLSTRDMAKIGQLMLKEGEWKGKQLVPKAWIKKTITTVTPHETLVERFGDPGPEGIKMSYGYMWWLFDDYKNKSEYKGSYSARGYGGQYITVFPAIDVVIAHKTKLGLLRLLELKKNGDAHYWEIMHMIIDSFKK